MGIERKSLKGGNLARLAEKAKAAKEANPNNNTAYEKAVFHKIENGKNVFRILPVVKEDEDPYEVSLSTMLEVETDEYSGV
jgi:hypothetical protein